jgi:hypothetical protein
MKHWRSEERAAIQSVMSMWLRKGGDVYLPKRWIYLKFDAAHPGKPK